MRILFVALLLGMTNLSAQNQIGNTIIGSSAGFASLVDITDSAHMVVVTDPNFGRGRGQVFFYQATGAWAQYGNDILSDDTTITIGKSISISGDGTTVAIGTNSPNGSVEIFKDSSGTWNRTGVLNGEAVGDEFGSSISLNADGTRIVVGGKLNSDNGPEAGHVRVYDYTQGTWNQVGVDIDGPDTNAHFGYCVDISSSGHRIAVAAPYGGNLDSLSNSQNYSSIRLYEDSLGSWVLKKVIFPNDTTKPGLLIALANNGNTLGYVTQGGWTQNTFEIWNDSSGIWSSNSQSFVFPSYSWWINNSFSISESGDKISIGRGDNNRLFSEDSIGNWTYTPIGNYGFGSASAISGDGTKIIFGKEMSKRARIFGTVPCNNQLLKPITPNCALVPTTVKLKNTVYYDSLYWSTGISDIDSIQLLPGNTTYTIEVYDKWNNCNVTQTFQVPIGGPSASVQLLPIDTVCTYGLSKVKIISNENIDSIYWSNGQNNSIDSSIFNVGNHWVYCQNDAGCDTTIYFEVFGINSPPVVQVAPIDTICPYSYTTIKLISSDSLAIINWSNGWGANEDSNYYSPGQHSVYYVNSLGCYGTTYFTVHEKNSSGVNIEPCYIYCDLDSGLNRVVLEKPNTFENIAEWQLQEDVFGQWVTVETRTSSDTSAWYHQGSNPFSKSYKYRVRLIDSCGIIRESSPVRTILLQSSLGTAGEVNLNWNSYEGTDIWYYVINRKSGSTYQPLDSVGSSTTSYIDNNPPAGNISYYISAVRLNSCASDLFKQEANNKKFSSNVVNENLIGIQQFKDQKILVYPNPTNSVINVYTPDDCTFLITDLGGKTLIKSHSKGIIDVSELSAGIYNLKIRRGESVVDVLIMKL